MHELSRSPDLRIAPEHSRPHLQSGFPWQTPDVVREPCSEERWWSGLAPVLARARQSGAGLAELAARRPSNHVPELARLIEALDLSEFVDAVYSSACIGVEEPHRRAFEPVFARHPAARAGWMMGDSWRADVQRAHAVGLRAMLVRGSHPQATIQCDTLLEIARIVEAEDRA